MARTKVQFSCQRLQTCQLETFELESYFLILVLRALAQWFGLTVYVLIHSLLHVFD